MSATTAENTSRPKGGVTYIQKKNIPVSEAQEGALGDEEARQAPHGEAAQDLGGPDEGDPQQAGVPRAEPAQDARVRDGDGGQHGRAQRADEGERRLGCREQPALGQRALHDAPAVARAHHPPCEDGAARHDDPAVAALGHLGVGQPGGLQDRVYAGTVLDRRILRFAVGRCR